MVSASCGARPAISAHAPGSSSTGSEHGDSDAALIGPTPPPLGRRSPRPPGGIRRPASPTPDADTAEWTAIERCPAWACKRLHGHARLPQPGQTRVAQLVAGAMRQTGPGPGAGDDLVQPLDRQRLTPTGSLQHHEQPVGRRVRRPLVVHVRRRRWRRSWARPAPAADGRPCPRPTNTRHSPRRRSSRRRPITSAAAQPAQGHGLHHGPIPVGAQRPHQRGQLLGIQDARQAAHRPHQRLAPQLLAVPRPPGRQTPRDRVRLHPHIAAGDQIPIERRHRRQTPADRRRRQTRPRHQRSAPPSPLPAGDGAARSRTPSHPPVAPPPAPWRRPLKNAFRSCAYARTVFGRARLAANSKTRPPADDQQPSARRHPHGRAGEPAETRP